MHHSRPLPDHRVFDAREPQGDKAFGDLPEWDFSALYAGEDDPKLSSDLDAVAAAATKFAETYEGKLVGADGATLGQALMEYEHLDLLSNRIMTYAALRYYQNTTDQDRAKFFSDMQSQLTDISSALVFFTLEMNRIEDDALKAAFAADETFARYKPVIDRMRSMKPYQLSDELEKFLHDQSVVGASAWNRLFDETMAALTFDVNGEVLSLEATLDLMSNPDRSRREAGARALITVFRENLPLFSRITNTLAKEKEIEDRWRKMPTPQTYRHLSNHVEPEVVNALRDAVVSAYPRISHRFYALKAKWHGLDTLQVWDRNAPLPDEEEVVIQWMEAKDIVLGAYGEFDSRMAELAQPFFSDGWIDAAVKPGKAPGAFAHPASTDSHPFVMLNYLGKRRDVMTLAHELGHGVHQRLAAGQGELLSSTPLTLAETASVFGEMLTFKRLLAAAPDKKARKALLASKVSDMINTVVRQISFYDFECKLHAARREGELTPDDINAIWMSVQSESLGPVFEFVDGYETFWSYIPHFIHSPFYVYAYAFGDGLVNALYAVYEEGDPGFQEKYFKMLEAGGSMHHKDLLAPFGLDASDPTFWNKGLSLIESMIDELETLDA